MAHERLVLSLTSAVLAALSIFVTSGGLADTSPILIICIGATNIVFGVHYLKRTYHISRLTSRPFLTKRLIGLLMISVGTALLLNPQHWG